MDAYLERKLRELIDRQEIWDVMLRYSRGQDRMDRELIRTCYHDDAVDDHHLFVGMPEDFIDWSFGYSEQYNVVHHHGLSNHTCQLDGDDAHAETYYTFLGVNREPPHMLSMGRYIDHLQRRNGEWRIANRVCVIEHSFQLHDNPSGASSTPVEVLAARLGEFLPATRDRNDLSYHRPLKPRRPR